MSFSHIPPSPNWYCSKVSDVNATGLYVFGARSNVYIFKTNGGNHGPPQFIGLFSEHKDRVSSTMLGQTEETLGSCCSTSDDGVVKVWDTSSKITIKSHSEHKDKITCGSWSNLQDDLIVTGDERGNIICWQFKTDICQKFKQEKEYIFSIACSPHKKFHVAVGYKSGNVLILDITKNCRVLHRLRGHDDEIHCIVWCPVPGETIFTEGERDEKDDDAKTGCIIATGSRDRTIKFWSSEKGRQLFQKKLPINTGYKREQREEGRNKVWLTLYWRKEKYHQLVSSSHGGELILWDILPSAEKPMQLFTSNEGRGHTRVVFNICASSTDEDHLYTISMDRLIGVWSLRTMSCINSLPSLGGYLYTIKSSPVDPGRLALGVGDSMIRVWNTNNKTNSFDFQSLWQGIKSKVTCLSWHPSKESWLAYGTDDGRVGIYDVFSQKPPLLSGTFHRKTVYVVAWGPPSKCTEENFSNFSLYTVGDGVILEHHPKVMSKEATNINQIIESVNGKKTPGSHLIRSDISWKPDYSLVAIGNEDGSVDVYWADFKLRCVIQVHRKLINCLQWHPHITTQGGSVVSTCNTWLASGANDAMVHIVDLSDIPVDKPVTIIESMRRLEGHTIRVTGLSWSPHVDGRIASCGYDSSVIVWNVKSGTALVKFDGHQGRILTVLWSGLDPDEVISGGFDCSLHRWKISSLPKAVLEYGNKRKKNRKKKPEIDNKKRDHRSSTGSDSNDASGVEKESTSKHNGNKMADSETNTTVAEYEELQKLLEKKKQELMKKAGNEKDNRKTERYVGDNKVEEILGPRFYKDNSQKSNKRTEYTDLTASSSTNVRQGTSSSTRKQRKSKSYFPVTAQTENRGKLNSYNDLINLTRLICGEKNKTEVHSPDGNNFGLYTNRRAAFRCLKREGEYHEKNENMEYYLQMEIWKGNIRGALQVARERDELSDWLVSMAPLGSYEMWLTACEDYARQLEDDGQYHKSSTYLLACHKVYDAIELFKRHRLYKEAVALAKVRLSPMDPMFEDLYTDWSQQLMKDGQYEQAAKCYVAMKKIQDAAKVIVRRCDQSSLKTAAHMTLIANEKQQGMLYAQRVVNQSLLQFDWHDAYKFLSEHETTKIFVPFVSLHELLVKELQKLCGDFIGPISDDKFSVWGDIPPQNSVLPDFLLDESETDPVLPWKPVLCGKHSFPHHILRCWCGNLDIPMDTNSLSNIYKTLIHHQSGRQGLLDTNQIILQVSNDLTLFLLALLLNETSAAINHLLQGVVSLHDAGQTYLMRAVCQLVLPHGPKYLLKLQQEVTALHVVMSIDSRSNIEGASKVNTLKRLLSELKDDDNISSTGHRCRELDCLRAYYYLTVLQYIHEEMENCLKTKDLNKGEQVSPSSADVDSNEPDVCARTPETEVTKEVDSNLTQCGSEVDPSQTDQSKSELLTSAKTEGTSSSTQVSKQSLLKVTKLLDLSKGLLWDIQAKRYAMTETLGYIHKAISQCLLTDKIKEKTVSEINRPDILLCSKGDKSDGDGDRKDDQTAEDDGNEGEERGDGEKQDGADEFLEHTDVEMMLLNGSDSSSKSRKVLWEDQPPLYICDKHETGSRSSSCLLNPTKYINVPDEWYSLPVDKKYLMPYVSMPVLREEQEFVTHELKRIPDSHVPFPNTFETAKMLLKITQMCEEKDKKKIKEYREKLVKWALNFAVNSKQREEFSTLSQTTVKESAV